MLWEISILIFTVTFLLFVFFSILYLLQLRRTARNIEIVLHTLNQSLPEIMAKLNATAGYLSDAASIAKRHMEGLSTSVIKVQNIVDDISDFERTLRREIETPLLQAVGSCQAVMKGIRVFWSSLLARS
jgi:hypothetical protein